MKKQLIYLVLLLVVTSVLYFPSLKNKLNNWDDAAYILSNPYIELTKVNVERSFLQGEAHRMYAPLTALSNSIVYHFYKLNPEPYILTNIIIHLFNIVFVFIFISLLIKNPFIPIITAALFAIHPMQVEAVGMAAGKRDVLYVFFYLLCVIFYLLWLERKKQYVINYVLSLFFALLALLSKGQALTIPFTLVLISLFMNRKWNSRAFWIDKLPFFLVSVIIAFKVFAAPQYAEGVFTNTSYLGAGIPFLYRLVYAGYGFIQYIILLLVPYKLSLVHPYPEIAGKYFIPVAYFFYVLILLGLIYFFFRYALKNKVLWFGLAFFAVNIFMLLQLMPNSYGIMNDHYVYFAGLGVFLIIGEKATDKFLIKKYSLVLVLAFITYLTALGFLSFRRMNAFKNNITVWSDVIDKYPDCFMAYNDRGLEYYNKGNSDKAINDFNNAIALNPDNAEAYNNRGVVFADQGAYDKAVADYTKAAELKSNYLDAYYNRANAFINQKLYDRAIDDYTKVIALNPASAEAYNNRGATYNIQKLYDNAIADYSKAIELMPNYALAYKNLSDLYYDQKVYDEAITDYTKVIELKPDNDAAYRIRGNVYSDEGAYNEAIADYTKAIELNPGNAATYNNRGAVFYNEGLTDKACNDFYKAQELGSEDARVNVAKYCNHAKINE